MKWLLLLIGILAIDVVTKKIVHASLLPSLGTEVFRDFLGIDFYIRHVTNKGAAWGVGGNFQQLLLWVRVAVLAGLGFYTFFSSKAEQTRIPLIMILAGGLGNVIDYFIYGHVIDMFHFIFWGYSYPVFNIADSSIFLGIAWLLIRVRKKKHVLSQN